MGSSCSILNDTSHDVWMHHEIDWEAFITATSDLLKVLQEVSGHFALRAEEEEEESFRYSREEMTLDRRGTASSAVAERRIVGLTKKGWITVGTVLGMTDVALAGILHISQIEAEKIRSSIQEFQKKAKLIMPGKNYTCDGTLSQTMRVYVMNDKLQFDDQLCVTSDTSGCEKVYTISRHFRKLDVY